MRAAQFLVDFMYQHMQDEAHNNLMLVSNNVAYKRAAFTAVHGFNETFPLAAGEDMELGFRLAAHGYRQGYWPTVQVWHHHNLSSWGHIRQQFRYGRGGHFFLQSMAELSQRGLAVRPESASSFYSALGQSVKQKKEPWSFSALVAAAQVAYRLGQFYQRQVSHLARLGTFYEEEII
jgi:cellulose synthase/poly-beta-1,6-N-acetylglucosamine synthase-like glycosyltransferase